MAKACRPAQVWDEAESVCQSKVGSESEATRLWDLYPEYETVNQKLWKCSGSLGGSDKNSRSGKAKKRKPKYVPPTGVTLNQTDLKLSAVDGLYSGIQFQRVDRAGMGIQSILDLGFLDAVDVWSNIGGGYEVCFPQKGRIVFKDTGVTPHVVSMDVEYEYRDAYTCALLNRAGQMVLVKGSSQAQSSTAQAQEFIDSTRDPVSAAIALENCSAQSQPAGRALGREDHRLAKEHQRTSHRAHGVVVPSSLR